MVTPVKHWRIDVLHHSHTDIGYTERQEKICRAHADYLRQVLKILRAADADPSGGQRGFCWQCENHWQVENFLRTASPRDREDLVRYVREGRIGLSASYLNLTDLIGDDVLREHLRLARDWADGEKLPLLSAMTADVNGYSAALPDALSDIGVKYFYSALHTHHGMYPLGRDPAFFVWRGPRGGRVLTFVGEHYHWGHVLGLCPHGTSSFMLRDDFLEDIEGGRLFSQSAERTEEEEVRLAIARIDRYLAGLEEHGWPLSLVPVFVSGILSDNSPPNGRVAERVNRLNEVFGGRVTLRMTTLDSFFRSLEEEAGKIPEYAGDFTDWWADGVGSTPEAVKLYREAQRTRRMADLLDPEGAYTDPALRESAGRNMMLYAEHTWGHSASASDPALSLVNAMTLKKTGYAVQAHNDAFSLLDGVLEGLGNRAPYPDRPHRFRVINPYPFRAAMPAAFPLLGWEYLDGCPYRGGALALRDVKTGALLPAQTFPGPRGLLVEGVFDLGAGETAEAEICHGEKDTSMPPHTPWMCADAVTDLAGIGGLALPEYIQTPFFTVRTDGVRGVSSIVHRPSGQELVDPLSPRGAFTCLYEVTPTQGSVTSFRRRMGRRRQTADTRVFPARPRSFSVDADGPLSVTLRIGYDLEGTDGCTLEMKIHKLLPRIDARLRLLKRPCRDPEGVRAVLPLVTDGDNETWIDKTGCAIRPGIDQLPGTCKSFWCLQNGLVRRGRSFDLLLASPDVPLISFGPDQKGPVTLCDGQDMALNRGEIHSRMMNNFWETNFPVDLGGWHEFRYVLLLTPPFQSPGDALDGCAALAAGFPVLEL